MDFDILYLYAIILRISIIFSTILTGFIETKSDCVQAIEFFFYYIRGSLEG